jgi:hypothetical protein
MRPSRPTSRIALSRFGPRLTSVNNCSSASHCGVPLPSPAAVPARLSDDPSSNQGGALRRDILLSCAPTARVHHNYPHLSRGSTRACTPPPSRPGAHEAGFQHLRRHSDGVIPHSAQLCRVKTTNAGASASLRALRRPLTTKAASRLRRDRPSILLHTTPTAPTVYRLGSCPLDLNGRSADSTPPHLYYTHSAARPLKWPHHPKSPSHPTRLLLSTTSDGPRTPTTCLPPRLALPSASRTNPRRIPLCSAHVWAAASRAAPS